MTNKELIVKLLDCNLNAKVDFKKTFGTSGDNPRLSAYWKKDGQHAVLCSSCGCRVSVSASRGMNYCFIRGAKMEENK